MDFEDWKEDAYKQIISELSPPEGRAVSSATLDQELGDEVRDISEPLSDLVRFGVLEFVNTSGSNMHARVRLRKPTPENSEKTQLSDYGLNSMWLAYVVSEHNARERRARRLFNDREAAEEHLAYVANADSLVSVPGVDNVWCEYLSRPANEYAVLRNEPVFPEADNPWP